MNYYPRHIGDYLKDTAHLSLLEHGVYTRLLDVYYSTEKPIPAASAARLVGARTPEEIAAVNTILAEFFALDGDNWVQDRCEREIRHMQEKQAKAQASAAASVNARRTNAQRTLNERSTDVEPTQSGRSATNTNTNTNNQIPPNPRKRGKVEEFPPGFEAFWSAYPRKQAKPAAAKAFARLRADESLLAQMLASVAVQSASEQWRKDGGQFIPLAATWINGRRWEDEVPGAAPDQFAGAL